MICLDTAILIWGVQGKSDAGFEHMVERTEMYLRRLSEDGRRVMVPAPVVAEYLGGLPVELRDRQQALLQRRFFVPAFDAPAAMVAAELFSAFREHQSGTDGLPPRQCLKVDFQIAATAIHRHADCIVTSEASFFGRICGSRIEVIEVPIVAEKRALPLG